MRMVSVLRGALLFAVLLAALTLVIWRQGRARAVLTKLDRIRMERAVAEAERAALERGIAELESRGRVVAAARRRLDMHVPTGAEIVILPIDTAPAAPERK